MFENVAAFVKVGVINEVIDSLASKLKSSNIYIVSNVIKCFCVIAFSKEWEHKLIAMDKKVLDQILGLIFADTEDENA